MLLVADCQRISEKLRGGAVRRTIASGFFVGD
jgi:hypothetical protein